MPTERGCLLLKWGRGSLHRKWTIKTYTSGCFSGRPVFKEECLQRQRAWKLVPLKSCMPSIPQRTHLYIVKALDFHTHVLGDWRLSIILFEEHCGNSTNVCKCSESWWVNCGIVINGMLNNNENEWNLNFKWPRWYFKTQYWM